jgi:hypothetical protein
MGRPLSVMGHNLLSIADYLFEVDGFVSIMENWKYISL